MFLRRLENEYGTPVIECSCDFCGTIFTVCWGKEYTDEEAQNWGKAGCQHESCKSYNPKTDMNKMFLTPEEIAREKVVHIDVLRNRKNLKVFCELDGKEIEFVT